jgi:hypothetical protein
VHPLQIFLDKIFVYPGDMPIGYLWSELRVLQERFEGPGDLAVKDWYLDAEFKKTHPVGWIV